MQLYIEKEIILGEICVIISLMGFMGAGKTSVGKILAKRLDYDLYDTDLVIREQTGLSIKKIFSIHGEEYFRCLESEVLKQIIEQNDDIVIATGGGIVLSEQNIYYLKKYTLPILLEVSPFAVYQRLKAKSRPLIETENQLESIKKLMREREELYNVFSNKIDSVKNSPEDVVEEILQLI